MEVSTILQYLTLLAGFYMAWNIGANDVANAMGTSVGSRALTIKKAVLIAAILEFSGSVLVGSTVSETIQRGIVNPEVFQGDPMIFIIGMLGALIATGIWLQLASYLGLPVSTTHAIVGAVLGFGALIGGMDAVHWGEITEIAFSWVLSPVLSGIIAYFLFGILQKKIFFALNPLAATRKLAPYLVFFCFTFFSLSILFQGLSNLDLDLSFPKALLFSLFIGLIASLITVFLIRKSPHIPYEIENAYANSHHAMSLEKAMKHLQRVQLSSGEDLQKKVSHILGEVHKLSEVVKSSAQIEQPSSSFSGVEKIFVYLQIISACLVAFAHGANDVANAIGPVAAVVSVLQSNTISAAAAVPLWLLVLGGGGIVLGLATWGWRVIETIGKKITELTPSRGFCAEFSAGVTILLASKMGLPISTTHSLVGAVLGVGLARGIRALNLKTLKDIVLSWIATIPICAILSILVFYVLRAILL
jgi:inorganic phosphate transporter, PiT family